MSQNKLKITVDLFLVLCPLAAPLAARRSRPHTIANRAIIEVVFEGDIERCVFGSTPAMREGQGGGG